MGIQVNMLFCELLENRYNSIPPSAYERSNEETSPLLSGQSCQLLGQILKTRPLVMDLMLKYLILKS